MRRVLLQGVCARAIGRAGQRAWRLAWLGGVVACIVAVAGARGMEAQQPDGSIAALSEETRVRLTDELLSKHVTVQVARVSRARAIDAIAASAKIPIQYQTQLFDAYAGLVTVDVHDGTLRTALEQVLRGTSLGVVADASSQLVIVDRSVSGSGLRFGQIQIQTVDSTNGHGLSDVSVQVLGTSLRCLTDKDGRCSIAGVSAGEHRVNARRVGYIAMSKTVTVADGESITIRFAMTPAATVLAGVVTTATGQQKRLEVANDITTLNVDSLVSRTPVRTVTDLLAQRVPGLHVTRSSGDPGSPARIRIRGISSATLNNDPVVIIDGIRMSGAVSDSSVVNPIASVPATPSLSVYSPGFTVASRLDDIDPNSIQTIEVLKGPSAAALYGTDAANGVIVITTKRGQPGTTRWSVNLSHDWTSIPVDGAPIYNGWGHRTVNSAPTYCPISGIISGTCIPDSVSTFNPLNDAFTTNQGRGYNTILSTAVSGGGSQVQYSVTGSRSEQVGARKMPEASRVQLRRVNQDVPESSLRPNGLSMTDLTARITAQPYRWLDMSFTMSGVRQLQRNDISAIQAQGSQDPRDTLTFLPANYTQQASSTRVTRGIAAFTTAWRPVDWFTSNLDLGADHTTRRDQAATNQFVCDTVGCVERPQSGYRGQVNETTDNYTTNLYGVFSKTLRDGVSSRSSIGGQYHRQNVGGLTAQGTQISAGSNDIRSAANYIVNDINAKDATAGWFFEELLSVGQSLFLTGAVRQDAGSAFGSNIQAPLYPKVGVSWVVSNGRFFPTGGLIHGLKLRAAFGQSGVQPRATDAPPTYQNRQAVINGQVVSTVEIASVGNSLLNPERSVEMEGGFDADLFGDRAHIEFTTYNKRSRDALISRALGPSVGSLSLFQMENIGAVVNRGVETTVSGTIVEHGGLLWTGTVGLTLNRNRVASLGDGVLPFGDSTSRIAVGYPLFGRWIKPVLAYNDVNGDGFLSLDEIVLGDTLVYAGQTEPRYSLSYSSTITLPFGVSVDANMGYDAGITQIQSIGTDDGRGINDPSAPFSDQAQAEIRRLGGSWQTISVLRLNSVSVNYTLPQRFVRSLRSTSATLSLSGTNLGLWTQYRGNDPSVNSSVLGDQLRDDGSATPLTRNYSLSLRLGF